IVAPERDTPGHNDRHWNSPMASACPKPIWSTLVTVVRGLMRSTIRMTMPPAKSAHATVAGPNRLSLIQSCTRAPASRAGTVVVMRRAQPRGPAKPARALGRSRSRNTRRSRTTTARIAPSWMKVSNVSDVWPLKPRRRPATMRCPVDATGRNSVRPSTIPSRIAIAMRPMGAEPTGTRAGVARARIAGEARTSDGREPTEQRLVLQPLHAGDFHQDPVPGDRAARRVAHEDRLVPEPADLARAVQQTVLRGREPLPARRLLGQTDHGFNVVGMNDLHPEILI